MNRHVRQRISGVTVMIFLAARAVAQQPGLLDVIGSKLNNCDPELYATERQTSATIEKKEQNFSILHPGGPWRAMRPEKLHPLAVLAFERRDKPELFCAITASSTGDSRNTGESPLGNIATGVREGITQHERIDDIKTTYEQVGDLRFARIVALGRPTLVGLPMVHEHWITTKGGFTWDIVTWALAEHRDELAKETRRIVTGFHVLDAAKVSRYAALSVLTDVEKRELGYSTKLAGGAWGAAPIPEGSSPLADFMATRAGAALMVVPLRFDEKDVPDMVPLAHGLLGTLGFDYPGGGSFETEKKGADVLEITTKRTSGRVTWHYMLRVVRGEGAAWLVAGWLSMDPQRVNGSQLRDALNAVKLFTPSPLHPRLTGAQKVARGEVFNMIGVGYLKQQDAAAAARWCLTAFNEGGQAVALENAIYALGQAGKNDEALRLARDHATDVKGSPSATARIALMLVKAGDADAAVETFDRLVREGFEDENSIAECLGALLHLGRPKDALKIAEAFALMHPSPMARRWQALTLNGTGKNEDAAAVLNKLIAEQPDDLLARAALGEILNNMGKYERAQEIGEKLLAKNFDRVRANMIIGWSQMGRKQQRDAKATFEKAAALAPDREDVKRAIAYASAATGQGNNTEIKTFLEPVAMPKELTAAVEGARELPESETNGQPAVWLERSTGYYFKPGEPRRLTVRRRVKILTKEGADTMSTIEQEFDPLSERVFVNRLEVRDPEGKLISKGDVSSAYVRDLDEGDLVSHRKMLHVQVSGVTPGCAVDYEITTQDLDAEDGFRFEHHPIGSMWPSRSELVFVTGSPKDVNSHQEHAESLRVKEGDGWKAWFAAAPMVLKFEPMSLPFDQYVPMLWLGGGGKDWKTVGQDYLHDIADRLKPDAAAVKAAAKLTAGLKTDREKVAALARHVQKEINYKGIEFGVRARRPNSAAETLEHRYGDCKDHALLLHQLLHAAGIPSFLTLVNTKWRTVPELPTLDQFNHVIVQVPSLGAGGFVDCTGKYGDVTGLPPPGMWRMQPFVIDPAGSRLLEEPKVPEGSAKVECVRKLAQQGDDDVMVDETITMTGYYGAFMRESLAPIEPERQLQAMQAFLAKRVALELRAFDFDNLRAPEKPAVMRMKYLVRHAISGPKGGRTLALPAPLESSYLKLGFVKDRKTPFETEYPLNLSSKVTVNLPAGLDDAQLRDLEHGATGAYCEWKVKPVVAPSRELELDFHFAGRTGHHPAAEYPACQEAWEAAFAACEQRVPWK